MNIERLEIPFANLVLFFIKAWLAMIVATSVLATCIISIMSIVSVTLGLSLLG